MTSGVCILLVGCVYCRSCHHIPSGVMKIKKKEFLSLKQGEMSVAEYRDKFTELSCYATEEVAEDRKK
jgi:hypothetical protein